MPSAIFAGNTPRGVLRGCLPCRPPSARGGFVGSLSSASSLLIFLLYCFCPCGLSFDTCYGRDSRPFFFWSSSLDSLRAPKSIPILDSGKFVRKVFPVVHALRSFYAYTPHPKSEFKQNRKCNPIKGSRVPGIRNKNCAKREINAIPTILG